MKSPITYYGAKSSLAEKMILHVPHKMDRYVEPFFGSGGLFFARPRWAQIEIINDLNGDVVNFFRVLRDKPRRLIEALQMFPHARQEQREAAAIMEKSKNEIMRALYFFVRINQSFNAARGWSIPVTKNKAQEWKNKTDPALLYEVAARLRFASFENYPALKVMKLYDKPSTFQYLDPPYLSVTDARGKNDAYRGFDMIEDQHVEFIETCLKMKSMIMISGYDHPIYNPLTAAGWRKVTIPHEAKSVNHAKKGDYTRNEILWLSPNVKTAQNTLF